MKIRLDQPRCEGHGLCEEAAPDLMHLDDGELVLAIRSTTSPSATACTPAGQGLARIEARADRVAAVAGGHIELAGEPVRRR